MKVLAGCRLLLALFCLGIAAAVPAWGIEKSTLFVPMRDGVRLATDLYLPDGNQGPLPAILVRTPYNKDGGGRGIAEAACSKGYACVVQDTRGRFQSEGSDAIVFQNDGWGERRDGQDTLAWLTAQPWSNGTVGSWGASALGIVQNMTAPGAPDSLRAQYVMVAFSDMYSQSAFQGGAFRQELVERWLTQNGFDPENLAMVVAHPRYDDLWATINPEAQAHRVNAPGVFYGGWYDIFVQGTINSFLAIQEKGGPRAKGNCRLVVGPWAHGSFKGLHYPGDGRPTPPAADPFRYFDHFVRDIANGADSDKPVNYYVMGDPETPHAPGNFWRSVDTWPPPSRPLNAYFHADGSIDLEPPSEADGKRTYRYDPRDPVPTLGGQNLNIEKGPLDQRTVETRPDVLVFTSPVLDHPYEVTGRLSARLYVESDCPDTDFTVKVCDVYPDGRSMIVTDGILRMRFRESFTEEKLLETHKVYEIAVDLWSTSLVFNTGHRLRVAVSSSNAPRFEPNPNTGRPFRADDETRVATNTLHLSSAYPSCLVLPIYAGEETQATASAP